MKLYKDSELKQQIESTTVDLGVVTGGVTERFDFYVVNDSGTNVHNIQFNLAHPEIKIVSAPTSLKKEEVGQLSIECNPLVTVKEGLSAKLTISYSELWLPPKASK